MSALALIYKKIGAKVLGSDIKEEFFSDKILRQAKIKILKGFSSKNLPAKCDFIVCSNAYLNNENAEYFRAIKRGYQVLSYPEAVAALFNNSFGIAVAGSHGKTTLTAMIAEIIKEANLPLIALVGSEVLNWRSNVIVNIENRELEIGNRTKKGKLPFFTLEADEYREAFLNYTPKILLITNIDWDHPDYFKKKTSYIRAFKKMIKKTLANGGKVILSRDAQKTLGTLSYQNSTSIIAYENKLKFKLQVAGDFNQYNANGAYALAKELKIKDSIIKKALSGFRGTRRRMEEHRFNIKLSSSNFKILMIDDYAHHPTEIKETLRAIKQKYCENTGIQLQSKKIWVFFQPHTFSRTKTYLPQFIKALKIADKISIVETFGSARESKGFSAKNLAKHIQRATFHKTIDDATQFLKNIISKNPIFIANTYIIVTMGAGDIWKIRNNLSN